MQIAVHPFRQLSRRSARSAATARRSLRLILLVLLLWGGRTTARGAPDPFETLEALGLGRDSKQGYVVRADTWSGDLPADGSKRIEHTLLRGNDYRFYAYTTTKGSKISFHLQDHDGRIVEAHSWQQEKDGLNFAGADIVAKSTGSYYLIVKVEQSSAERTDWSLVYAYK